MAIVTEQTKQLLHLKRLIHEYQMEHDAGDDETQNQLTNDFSAIARATRGSLPMKIHAVEITSPYSVKIAKRLRLDVS
jgi:hypothetical protein